MANLTATQQAIIDSARDDVNGSIYPLPANLKGGAALINLFRQYLLNLPGIGYGRHNRCHPTRNVL